MIGAAPVPAALQSRLSDGGIDGQRLCMQVPIVGLGGSAQITSLLPLQTGKIFQRFSSVAAGQVDNIIQLSVPFLLQAGACRCWGMPSYHPASPLSSSPQWFQHSRLWSLQLCIRMSQPVGLLFAASVSAWHALRG